MMPLARAGMEVARRLSATFVLPGNVYAFGEDMPALLQESTPERPTTEKGRQRQALEAEMAAQADRGLRSIVIRAGDFFGHGSGNWFDQMIVKEVARGRLCYPGPMQVPHAWAYLPDLARCVVALASRNDLPMHARLHFPGHTLTGTQLLDGIEAAARSLGLVTGAQAMKRSSMSWAPLRVAGLVVPLWRELARMSYLWRVPHELDGRALSVAIGAPPATPLDEALRASLLELGHGTAGFPAAQAAA
jgi:nucleoside-diphosphate-sugar epimerase